MAKPFVKWVGGKGQLLDQIENHLPCDFSRWENVTYIEPFVGGGAMLFYILQRFSCVTSAVINDINSDLTNCYNVVKNKPNELVVLLSEIQSEYHHLKTENSRKDFFLQKRELYNTKSLSDIVNASLFIFLNRTCFNGLYRVNRKGLFNVPFGKFVKPTICDAETIYADSELLQKVEILNGDFEKTYEYKGEQTLFYFDPPYRPISSTSAFTDYTKESFNDTEQVRLKEFCDKINGDNIAFILSNSDGKNDFFDELYSDYHIDRVFARRNINSVASQRGKLTEILVYNY